MARFLTCHISPSSVELCRFKARIWGRSRTTGEGFLNPNGIPPQSPRSRGTSHLGSGSIPHFQPQRGCGPALKAVDPQASMSAEPSPHLLSHHRDKETQRINPIKPFLSVSSVKSVVREFPLCSLRSVRGSELRPFTSLRCLPCLLFGFGRVSVEFPPASQAPAAKPRFSPGGFLGSSAQTRLPPKEPLLPPTEGQPTQRPKREQPNRRRFGRRHEHR